MTDEEIREIIQRCREDADYYEFVKAAIEIDDPIIIAAATVFAQDLANNISAEEAAWHAADFLTEQGRTDAAERIRNNFIPTLQAT